MIEFLESEVPFYAFLVAMILSFLIDAYFSNIRAKRSYADGFTTGKADLDREILRAENKAYVNGYNTAKKELSTNTHKVPAKQPSKPSNNGRASVAVNKQKLPPPPPPPAPRLQNEFGVPVKASRKPVAKKPVKGAKAK